MKKVIQQLSWRREGIVKRIIAYLKLREINDKLLEINDELH